MWEDIGMGKHDKGGKPAKPTISKSGTAKPDHSAGWSPCLVWCIGFMVSVLAFIGQLVGWW